MTTRSRTATKPALMLQGWEVKALRAGRLQFADSYALIKGGELFLFGAQITPLMTASTPRHCRRPPHPQAAPAQTRDRQTDRRPSNATATP